jgi:MraZ protein
MATSASNESIFYSSLYRHGVDDKRRVQVPAKWRPGQPEVQLTLILWNSAQGACLRVLPPSQIQALLAKIEAMPTGDPEAVALRRNIAKNSDQVTIDKSGRICIPEQMARAAGIGKEAVMAGALQWFEIWNPERYDSATAADEVLSPEALKKI